jgi:phosphohistidine phosphatase
MRSARRMGEFLAFMDVSLDAVIHSTKKRAAQTAQLLTESIRPAAGVREEKGLSPNDDPAPWVERINAMTGDTAIVGHLPFLDRLLSLLVLGDAGKTIIDFKAAGTVCLKPSGDGKWLITWALSPEVIW